MKKFVAIVICLLAVYSAGNAKPPFLKAYSVKMNLAGFLPVDPQYRFCVAPDVYSDQYFSEKFFIEEGVGYICKLTGKVGHTGVPFLYTKTNYLNAISGTRLNFALYFGAHDQELNNSKLKVSFGIGSTYDCMHGDIDQEERLLVFYNPPRQKNVQVYKEQASIQAMIRVETVWKTGLMLQYDLGVGSRKITDWENTTQVYSGDMKPALIIGVKIGYRHEQFDPAKVLANPAK